MALVLADVVVLLLRGLGELLELLVDPLDHLHGLRHLLLQVRSVFRPRLPRLRCRLPRVRRLTRPRGGLPLRQLVGQFGCLLSRSPHVLGHQILNLGRVVARGHWVVVAAQVLRMLCLVSRHLLLLLVLLLLLRQHHVLLEVRRWKDEIDGVLCFLLTDMLLEELRYGILDALQIEQKVAVKSLFGGGIQGLVLMNEGLGVRLVKAPRPPASTVDCPEVILVASGVSTVSTERPSRRPTPFKLHLLILDLRVGRLELLELLSHHLLRVNLINDVEQTHQLGLVPRQHLQR